MRSKDTILKKEIYDFVNGWKRDYGTSPSLKKIADQMQVSRTTVYRYLKEISEETIMVIRKFFRLVYSHLKLGLLHLADIAINLIIFISA